MIIIAGGYEGGLVGLEIRDNKDIAKPSNSSKNKTNDARIEIEPIFRFLCSQGSIRCMTAGKDFIACGSADETVQIYNLKTHKKYGELMLSEGCVTALGATGKLSKGTLLVGDESGDLKVYDLKSLQLLKRLKGHVKAISGISVHRDESLFISVGDDSGFRLWSLKSHLCIFYSKLEAPPIDVVWSENGINYIILCESGLFRCSVNESEDVVEFSPGDGDKYTCCCWIEREGNDLVIVAGMNSGNVAVYSGNSRVKQKISKKRIKDVLKFSEDSFIAGDSGGKINCVKLPHFESGSLEMESQWSHDTEIRINVLCSHRNHKWR